MQLTPETLVKKVGTVSSLPTIFIRINQAVNDPRSSNRDISSIINEDAGLAVRLLKIANSAFFSFPKKIDTIERAVTVIGTQQLRDLALATSVTQMFQGIPESLVSMESFWRHSIATGVTARILATYRRENNAERFFVAGLLHDVGRLIIFMKLPEQAAAILQQARENYLVLHRVEKEHLGFDHAEVGGALLRQWQLPDHLVDAVAYHHRPDRSTRFLDPSLVHVADIIANAMQMGGSGGQVIPPMDAAVWEQLELSESILAPTLSQLERQYNDAVRFILPDEA